MKIVATSITYSITGLLFFFGPPLKTQPSSATAAGDPKVLIGEHAPEISEGRWINSTPLKLSDLREKVVLLEFWTYGCYNCRNTIPYLNRWYRKYAGDGFEIIGVHTPQFAAEKEFFRVAHEVGELGIRYPVVTDNDMKTWGAYHQEYWPVLYLIDKKGTVLYVHIGEGGYEETEAMIKKLMGTG